MLTLIVRRLSHAVVVLWVVSMLVFAATEVLPGDVAIAIMGQQATPEALEAIRDRLGLHRPAPVRYVEWLGGLLTGDLGISLANSLPDLEMKVSDLIAERIDDTIRLAGLAALVSVPLSVMLGLIAAMTAGSRIDRGIQGATLCFLSVPEYFVAALLVMLLAVQLRWLPVISSFRTGQTFWQMVPALVLPVITLTISVMAHMTRMTRAAVLNVLASPYIEMAILKGVGRSRIILLHALPNALAPIFNVIALNLAYMISGVVIVETVFNFPGMANLMVGAVSVRDIPLVQACAMIFCTAYVGLNLTADLLSIVVNPRLRHPR